MFLCECGCVCVGSISGPTGLRLEMDFCGNRRVNGRTGEKGNEMHAKKQAKVKIGRSHADVQKRKCKMLHRQKKATKKMIHNEKSTTQTVKDNVRTPPQ